MKSITRESIVKPIFVIIVSFFLTLSLISLLMSGKFLGWLLIFSYLGGKIQSLTGLDYWASRAISILIALAIVFYFPWFFSWRRKRRERAYILAAVVATVFCLIMSYAYKNSYFMPDGSPNKCVSRDIWGRLVITGCGMEYNEIGNKVEKMTPELALELAISNTVPPKINRVVPDMDYRLFTSKGGPLLWFYQYPDGKLEFFTQSGKHPIFNIDLIPINADIAAQLQKYLMEGRHDMIVANDEQIRRLEGTPGLDNSPEVFTALSKLSQMLKGIRRQ